MKKLSFVTVALAVALSACTGNGSTNPTPGTQLTPEQQAQIERDRREQCQRDMAANPSLVCDL